MKRTYALIFMLLTTVLSYSSILAYQNAANCKLSYLFNAWARSSPEGAPNSAIFGYLVSLGDEGDRLISATTPVAESVEFHKTVMDDNDVMQMQPVEDGLIVPGNDYLELQPGGLHIMLINLIKPLEAGSSFELYLNFENAGEVMVSVPVKAINETEVMDMNAIPMEVPPVEWEVACQNLYLLNSWARPAAAGMPNSAAYGLLLNLTDQDEVLINASTAVAEAVELHEMKMGDGDVMQMQPLEDGIPVPSGQAVLLQPGGLHIMLINLTGELAVDSDVNLTLVFTNGGEIELNVPVVDPETSMDESM